MSKETLAMSFADRQSDYTLNVHVKSSDVTLDSFGNITYGQLFLRSVTSINDRHTLSCSPVTVNNLSMERNLEKRE